MYSGLYVRGGVCGNIPPSASCMNFFYQATSTGIVTLRVVHGVDSTLHVRLTSRCRTVHMTNSDSSVRYYYNKSTQQCEEIMTYDKGNS